MTRADIRARWTTWQRVKTWWIGIPDLHAMSDKEFEEWRETTLARINCESAWLNYKRSDEWKFIERKYNRTTWLAFFISYTSLFFLLWALNFDDHQIAVTLTPIIGAFTIGLITSYLVRKRFRPHSWEYILENYWPTKDGNPKTDVSAVPETVTDRFFHALWVLIWLAIFLYGIFNLVSMQA